MTDIDTLHQCRIVNREIGYDPYNSLHAGLLWVRTTAGRAGKCEVDAGAGPRQISDDRDDRDGR